MLSKLSENRNSLIAVVVIAALSYGIGRYLQPAKVEIKKEEVIREVEVIKRDVKIIEREIKRPDGTIEKERIEEDKSTNTTKKDTESKESSVVTNEKPQYRVRGGAGYDFNDKNMQYVIGGEKRFMGPLSLGLDVTLGQNSGIKGANVTASWEF